MAKIIDLDLLVSENIQFKIGGVTYEVPTKLNTYTTISLINFEQEVKKASKKPEDQIKLQDKMVHMLFSQLNDVTLEWVEGLDATQKKAIMESYRGEMDALNSNPNS